MTDFFPVLVSMSLVILFFAAIIIGIKRFYQWWFGLFFRAKHNPIPGIAPVSQGVFGEYTKNLYKKDYLMTKREAFFFRAISAYLEGKNYIICPKVRVEDIVGVRSINGFRPWEASGKLDRSHIDFLLIGKTDLRTKVAIEVDDTSHDTATGQGRDKIKDEALQTVGIPLVRIRKVEEIQEKLQILSDISLNSQNEKSSSWFVGV